MHRDITHEFERYGPDHELKAARLWATFRYPYLKTDKAKLEAWLEDLAWKRMLEIDRKHRYAIGEIQKCMP